MSANRKDMFPLWGPAFLVSLGGWFRPRQADILFVFVLLLVGCSYFVTEPLFTDHTIPNSQYYPFPSPRIAGEARWGHEFIVQALGGAGNQSVFNALGMIILVINGFLFAELMDARTRSRRIVIAMLVAFSPILLSYFAFSSDALSFALGDTAALLGVLVLWRGPEVWSNLAKMYAGMEKPRFLLDQAFKAPSRLASAVVAVVFFVFALSVYQPKLSLIACLVAFLLLRDISLPSAKTRDILQKASVAGATMALAAFLYWISFQIIESVSGSAGYNRTDINSAAEMLSNAANSYSEIEALIAKFAGTLPVFAALVLAVLSIFCFASLLWRGFGNGIVCGLTALALIALLPVGFRLSYVINQETFPDIARVMTGLAFMPAFVSAIALSRAFLASFAAAAVLAYASFTMIVQESGAIAMKSQHEILMVNRIVARIEPLLQADTATALVVLGQPQFNAGLYVPSPDRPLRPQTRKPAFISYRQIALTNFLIGKDIVVSPTPAQIAQARRAAEARAPWPSMDAVFRVDETIVVLLEENAENAEATR